MSTFRNGPRTSASVDIVCSPLPVTGSPLLGILALALMLAVVGVLLLVVGRRGQRARTAALLAGMLLLPAPLIVTHSQPASAQVLCPPGKQPVPAGPVPVPTQLAQPTTPAPPTTSALPTGTVRVAVVQTSTNAGMAPGVEPTTLVGEVRNTSGETVYVTDVAVRVTGVTKARNAVAGPCGPSDYVLSGRRMPVGAVLEPGQKARFTGARIGFFDKSVNQDACKGATVALGYTSS